MPIPHHARSAATVIFGDEDLQFGFETLSVPRNLTPARANNRQTLRQTSRTTLTHLSPPWSNIPDELQQIKRWILWRRVEKNGRWTKEPRSPVIRRPNPIDVQDAKHHVVFHAALQQRELKHETADGIGFVFMPEDPYLGIDLDHCRNSGTGQIDDWALNIILQLQSYTEITPSGEGFHIICRASLREHCTTSGRKIPNVGPHPKSAFEVYDQERFFTCTGDVLEGFDQVRANQADVDEIIPRFFALAPAPIVQTDTKGHDQVLTDEEVITRVKETEKGQKLWRGDTSEYNDDESAADMALIGRVAFFANGNHDQIDRVIRQSGLNRTKWDREDYIPNSIAKVVNSMPHFYGDAGASGITLVEMLNRYIYVETTTLVLDLETAKYVRFDAMRAQYPEEFIKWHKSHFRINKRPEEIVFKPGAANQNEINLWRPLTVRPDPSASCEYILELTRKMFGYYTDPQQYHWCMSWLAWPLKYPNRSKLDTSLVVHGCQGSGKNTLFENIMLKIYGQYGSLARQRDLEGDFNGWVSQKMFIVFDEVASSAQERKAVKNDLKSLITSNVILVNEKYMPLRLENNTINIVFMSNEKSPMVLEIDDRRFTTIEYEEKPDREFFEEVYREINNGGIEAFYHYLLNYDTQTWTNHSHAYTNDDKREMIQIARPNVQVFLDEWQSGELFVPFISCKSDTLWHAFKHWCKDTNIKNIGTKSQFTKDVGVFIPIMKHSRVVRFDGQPTRVRVPDLSPTQDEIIEQVRLFEQAFEVAAAEAYRLL